MYNIFSSFFFYFLFFISLPLIGSEVISYFDYLFIYFGFVESRKSKLLSVQDQLKNFKKVVAHLGRPVSVYSPTPPSLPLCACMHLLDSN